MPAPRPTDPAPSPPKSRRPQVRLLTLIILMTVVCVSAAGLRYLLKAGGGMTTALTLVAIGVTPIAVMILLSLLGALRRRRR